MKPVTFLAAVALAVLILPFAAEAGGVHGQVYGSVQWGGPNHQTYQRHGGVVVHPGAVIVYPRGVTTVYPNGTGNPVYAYGAYADPRTCYVECFHVPRSQRHPTRYGGGNSGTNVRIWGSVEVR